MAKKKVEELTIEEKLQNALIPEKDQPYKIPQNWCWVRLESIGNLISGQDVDIKKCNTNKIGLPYLMGASNLNDNIFIPERWIENPEVVSFKDDIIISVKGTIGKIYYQKEEKINISRQIMAIRPFDFIKSNYLYYFLHVISNKLKILGRGLIPGIRRRDILNYFFPLPPLAEQERIANKLDTYISKLNEAKEKLEKVFDSFEYRKSIIIHKAFNGEFTKQWRKENNLSFNSWEKNKLSNLCVINPPKNIKNISDNTLVSVVPMANVSEDGYVMEYLTKDIKDVQKGLTNFIEGDVVFAKITPCMENGKSAIIGKLVNDIGFGTTEFYVFRCNDKLYNKYLHYLFRDKTFRINAKYYMRGSVGQQRLPKQYLENYILNLPPLEEQKEIVKILDSLLSKEKQVKEIAEKEIEKIDDLKKNLLTRAFGGLLGTNDPNEENSIELLKTVM